MCTFLVYTHPSAGHVFPLIPGLRELAARGHRVEVVTGPSLVEAVTAAGLVAHPVAADVLAVQVADYAEKTGAARLRKALSQTTRRGLAEMADVQAHIDRCSPDALLVDTITYGAQVAARVSGVRWSIVQPSLLPLPGRGIPPYGLGLAPMSGPLGRLRDRLGWAVVERLYAKALLPGVNELRGTVGLPPLTSPLQLNDQPDQVTVLVGEPLEYHRADLPAHVRLVGGTSWDPESPVPGWLDEPGDPWVLVTCSTEYQADEALARSAVEALRDEPVRVVITLADAFDSAHLIPAPNVRVERFVSHRHVLERAAAVVCPAGMGLTQKAVAAGVPVVAVPFGRDQPEVARRVVQAGAGVQLKAKKLRADRLRTAVRKAMAMSDQVRQVGRQLSDNGGPTRFAEAIEELVPASRPSVTGQPADR
jgi:UDP:flavonoid glycosyltransferase YjiC (YdhE family)